MGENLKEKYGLPTAITMVIGIVIGSGVFFKAEVILNATGGNLPIGILAWILGGTVMVSCAYVFAVMATKYEFVSGLVDYTEVLLGSNMAYYVGWYSATIYYPAMTSVLAWVSARYTCVLFGIDIVGGEALVLSAFYLIGIYVLNVLSPSLAGVFQVSTTVIKLIPLAIMAVVGSIAGFLNGNIIENFTTVVSQDVVENPLFTAVVATVFAYEGWIVALSINAELRDAKKNLPIALTVGTIVIAVSYIAYYVGIAGVASNKLMMENGEQAVLYAFGNIFGGFGWILFVFVIISCLGTLNGLMMGCARGLFALAIRGQGPMPKVFRQVDNATNMPTNSGAFGLLMCCFWLVFFYMANLSEVGFPGGFGFDSSELPIVAIYLFYIPIIAVFIKKEKDLSNFQRFIMPGIALAGCIFMMIATYYAHGFDIIHFLVIFALTMIIGVYFKVKSDKNLEMESERRVEHL